MTRHNTHVDHRMVKIVDEILCFFYSLKATNIKMDMQIKECSTELSFWAKIKEPIIQRRLDKIKKLLSSPRAHELEEYYWGLTGNDMTPSTELSLVGMMIDEYVIEYEEGSEDFFIKLVRNSELC
ncbi:MAG: hypothetical protein ACRC76_03330 [Proteocatella sp.]